MVIPQRKPELIFKIKKRPKQLLKVELRKVSSNLLSSVSLLSAEVVESQLGSPPVCVLSVIKYQPWDTPSGS